MGLKQRKDLLQDETTCALVVYHAFQREFGNDVDLWEPESVRLEAHQNNLEIPDENYDAYHAFRTLRLHPSVFWDGTVFENTVLALNKYTIDPTSVQTANPGQVAWAVEQIRTFEEDSFEFDYEPVAYTAISCQFFGLVTTPSTLEFAQEALEKLTPEGEELRQEVKKRWAAITDPPSHPFDETPEGVQLALLAAVESYLGTHRAALKEQLALL